MSQHLLYFTVFYSHIHTVHHLSHSYYVPLSLQSTPLHLAAGYNRVRIVQLLLQHGADVHAKDKGYVRDNKGKIKEFM